MKRWYYIGIAAAGVAGAVYLVMHTGALNFVKTSRTGGATGGSSDEAGTAGLPARMAWRTVARPEDGFKVELPADSKDVQIPAYNEEGNMEPVKMIFSTPDGDTQFAVCWEDNPPVARASNHIPDRTMDMARDGMLARTQTVLVNEIRMTPPGGYSGRDITAHNAGGGILDARMIYAGDRLYLLLALFPSANARREQDVTRFFNSFAPATAGGIPETLPAAPATNN